MRELSQRKPDMRNRKAYTREERRLMIIQALAIAVQKSGKDAAMTTADFANALHVTPSTKLRIILNEMVVEHMLTSRKEKHASIAGYRVMYQLPYENIYTLLRNAEMGAFAPKRRIRINSAQGSFWQELS